MGFRFLHLADLHLETSFGGRPETRERLRKAVFEAFDAAVDHAIERELHAVLAAGDLYDDALLSIRSELALQHQIQRLHDAGIWFLAACGNHDPGGPRHRSPQLQLERDAAGNPRERVHVFRRGRPGAVTVTDRSGEPVGVVVGAGHAGPAERANLAAAFPRAASGLPVVGLLHTHVATARFAGRHDRYAPSGQADFERPEYSYWALGHIHVRQRAVPGQPVYYAGNLQGRNPRETGEKGGLEVEAHAGVPAEPRFVRFAPARWERLTVRMHELPDAHTSPALVGALAERIEALGSRAAEVVVVLELSGETRLAPTLRLPEERATLEHELAARSGAVEVQLRCQGVTRPIDRVALRNAAGATSRAFALIERAARDELLLDSLAPRELAGRGEQAQLDYLRELIAELPAELVERSLQGGEA